MNMEYGIRMTQWWVPSGPGEISLCIVGEVSIIIRRLSSSEEKSVPLIAVNVALKSLRAFDLNIICCHQFKPLGPNLFSSVLPLQVTRVIK